jgi:hypothetical protein
MVADVQIKVNTIQVKNFINKLKRDIPKDIQTALNKVSAYGVKQITEKTQKGQKPDGGRFRGYAPSTKKDRLKRGRQVGFVDLTDTGQMFRSLTWKRVRNKSTIFFRRQAENRKASYHDFFGAGKKKVVRPFFAIGRKDENRIRDIFFKSIGVK